MSAGALMASGARRASSSALSMRASISVAGIGGVLWPRPSGSGCPGCTGGRFTNAMWLRAKGLIATSPCTIAPKSAKSLHLDPCNVVPCCLQSLHIRGNALRSPSNVATTSCNATTILALGGRFYDVGVLGIGFMVPSAAAEAFLAQPQPLVRRLQGLGSQI